MISFKILENGNIFEIIGDVMRAVPSADRTEIEEILLSFLDNTDYQPEIAVSAAHDCLLVRIFDIEYLFVYPIALTDTADAVAAADEIRLYSTKEEISLVFIDVPSDELSVLEKIFCHLTVDSEDESRDSYTVRAESELDLLDDLPSSTCGNLTLDALNGADMECYYLLNTDGEVNKYWGYDYRADVPSADGEYFLTEAYSEINRGTALHLAVRLDGVFVGEGLIYAFDLQGGAECAIRLLPQYFGRGVGTRALDLLLKIAAKIKLETIYATVDNRNLPSLSLFQKRMKLREKTDEKTRFYINL